MARNPKPPLSPSPGQPPVPGWIRQALGRDQADQVEFSAGAALALLDPVARSEDAVATLWRKRLALGAAAAVSGLEGRREGEAGLRDAFALRRPGDDPGPAGRMLTGWRALGEVRALRAADWPVRLPGYFDLAPGPVAGLLTDLGARFVARAMPLNFAAGAARDCLAAGPAYRGLALWLGDALLARALGWDRPVPLLAAHLPRADFRLEGDAWISACALAWGRGAVAALDLYADLMRRANALRSAHFRRQGKDAAAIFAALLTEDALAAQAGAEASDRAARRLFDKLTTLGLVRELTGRSNFRLYGL